MHKEFEMSDTKNQPKQNQKDNQQFQQANQQQKTRQEPTSKKRLQGDMKHFDQEFPETRMTD